MYGTRRRTPSSDRIPVPKRATGTAMINANLSHRQTSDGCRPPPGPNALTACWGTAAEAGDGRPALEIRKPVTRTSAGAAISTLWGTVVVVSAVLAAACGAGEPVRGGGPEDPGVEATGAIEEGEVLPGCTAGGGRVVVVLALFVGTGVFAGVLGMVEVVVVVEAVPPGGLPPWGPPSVAGTVVVVVAWPPEPDALPTTTVITGEIPPEPSLPDTRTCAWYVPGDEKVCVVIGPAAAVPSSKVHWYVSSAPPGGLVTDAVNVSGVPAAGFVLVAEAVTSSCGPAVTAIFIYAPPVEGAWSRSSPPWAHVLPTRIGR
jgi:hypothetical protein